MTKNIIEVYPDFTESEGYKSSKRFQKFSIMVMAILIVSTYVFLIFK